MYYYIGNFPCFGFSPDVWPPNPKSSYAYVDKFRLCSNESGVPPFTSECLTNNLCPHWLRAHTKKKIPGNFNPLVAKLCICYPKPKHCIIICIKYYVYQKQRNGTNLCGTESATCSVWHMELRLLFCHTTILCKQQHQDCSCTCTCTWVSSCILSPLSYFNHLHIV